MKKYIVLTLLFIIAFTICYIYKPHDDFYLSGKLIINEIVTKNENIIKDDDDEYSDYIELYNGYNYDIDLSGYHLSDVMFKKEKWTFPEGIIISAKSYLLIYASDKNRCVNNICHTNFKLNSAGETIILTDKSNNLIAEVKVPKIDLDSSYGYLNGKYVNLKNPTPGYENDKELLKIQDISDYTIRINEYMTKNKSSVYASDGNYYDFIELYNYGDKDIPLSGLYLSDKESKLKKYRLEDNILKAHDYKVIYFTDEKLDVETTPFSLSEKDKKIILSNGHDILTSIDIENLPKDISKGLVNDKWMYFYTPTPGSENTTSAFESVGD